MTPLLYPESFFPKDLKDILKAKIGRIVSQ
jgi:hypothetical protein